MDFESLKSQVSNLTLYDLKAGVRKVQNAVMNLTEMESKVREATNADPWGAPSSLMQEIAQGTHNYQQLNEIMPMIYKRFTDKTAEEWRQIYKSLQLLEFLIKNGSERVVDDARSHLSLIKMLKQFHYIDENGKDQGINVRNRSSELGKLLSDVEAIRAERKKARTNRNKYGGVEGGAGIGFSGGSGRFGGFGSESAGFGSGSAYSGEVFGDGGGFGGEDPSMKYTGTQQHRDEFEEYDAGDHEEPVRSPQRKSATTSNGSAAKRQTQPAAKPKAPEPDLFDFGDEPITTKPTTQATGNVMDDFGGMQSSSNTAADDDFDDFQSATSPAPQITTNPLSALSPPPFTSTTTSKTTFAAPQPLAPAPLNNILSSPSPAPSTTSSIGGASLASPPMQSKPLQSAGGFKSSGPNYFTSVRADINTPGSTPSVFSARATSATPSQSSTTSMANLGKSTSLTSTTKASGDAFANIWSMAGNKSGIQSKASTSKGPGLADMAKQKSSAGIWGSTNSGSGTSTPTSLSQGRPSNPTPGTAAQGKIGNGLDDLLG